MNTNEQMHHVQPLIDQVAELIRTGQHPDASPRFKPEATTQPKVKTLLRQAGEWHSRQAGKLAMLPNPPLAQIDEHVRYAVACMEADEQ